MNVEELRIGNYVVLNEYNKVIEPYIIEHVMELHSAPDFEPIPLTEDWLLKLGFKEHTFSFIPVSCYSIEVKKGTLVIETHSGNIKYFYLSKSDDFQGFNVDETFDLEVVEYVHQLQNLYFALTGEELHI